jgi:hypothetical protein
MDTLKRRSWDKATLSSQPEEEELEAVPTPKETSPPPAITLNPVIQVVPQTSASQTPVPAPRKFEPDEPEKKEDEKEKVKEGSRLTRKFKHFRKGENCESLLTCNNHTVL